MHPTFFPHLQRSQERGVRIGIYLLSAWMWGLGWLVAGLMLHQGVMDWPFFCLYVATGPLAVLAMWGVRQGYGQLVSVLLIGFIWLSTAWVHVGQGPYPAASLMNIAVLAMFAGWALRWMGWVLVMVLSQALLVRLGVEGVFSWGALLPLMFTNLFFGVAMLLVRRSYGEHVQKLAAAADQIAEHREYRRMLSSVVEQSPYSIAVVNVAGVIVYVNPTFSKQMGYTSEEVLGQKAREVSVSSMDEEAYQQMLQMIHAGSAWQGMLRTQTKGGDTLAEQVLVTPIYDDQGALSHFVQAKLDVSERVFAQERLQQLMYYDKLTQLPNRLALLRKLEDMLQQERERLSAEPLNHTPHIWHGVVLLDMDRFNQFNLAHGSEWGDALLVAAAAKLQALQVDDVQMWVARYIADQFVVVLEQIGGSRMEAREHARSVAVALQKVMTSVPMHGAAQDVVPVSFGIGTTVFPFVEPDLQADNGDRIVRRATIALAQAKDAGPQQIRAYAEQQAEQVASHLQIENELRTALAQEQLRMFVQPQYDKEGHVTSMEALVRWQHPVHGLIAPGKFIAVAERSGLIVPMGQWMLEQACALLNTPQMQQRNYSVSVNISARQFMQPNFVSSIQDLLSQSQVPAQRLVLEVTESMLLADIHDATQTMQQLGDMGVQFALDDFGTGYSSLSYLQRLPIHELKIDQSFIHELDPAGSSGVLVQAVLMIAKQLGLRVVAEGVEQQEDALLLQAWEPDILCQGYFFSKPMAVEQWLQVLETVSADSHVGKLAT